MRAGEGGPDAGRLTAHRRARPAKNIARVDRDTETFTSTRFVNLEELDDDRIKKRASILELDGVRHRALRSLLQRHNVLARLLDVPPQDNQRLIDWGNRIIGNTDPDYADVLLHSEESEKYRDLPFRSPASVEVFEYGRELARQRRGGGGTDLVSRLVNENPRDGVPLSSQDFDSYFLLLVVAGNETTRHTITHSVLALLQHPRQPARLRDDPSLVPGAVEEFLRWASPVHHFRRTAVRDVELGGKRIKEGDKVVMWFASGNRDEEVFVDPNSFDVTREDNDHVTFAKGGPHLCPGNLLARTEIRIMFEELIPRPAGIRLAGEVPRVRSNFVNGIKKLPVEVVLLTALPAPGPAAVSRSRRRPGGRRRGRRGRGRRSGWSTSGGGRSAADSGCREWNRRR